MITKNKLVIDEGEPIEYSFDYSLKPFILCLIWPKYSREPILHSRLNKFIDIYNWKKVLLDIHDILNPNVMSMETDNEPESHSIYQVTS